MATKRRRINDSAKATGKAYEIRDSGNGSVKGLILRVQPSGHRTYYIEIARGIRERIGRQDAFTLQAARAEAQKILGVAREKGADHFKRQRDNRREQKLATLSGFLDGAFRTYAQEHIASHEDMIARLKKSFAEILHKSMAEIAELDLTRWRRGREGVKVETMRRELTYLKSVLNHAVAMDVIPRHQIVRFTVKAKRGEEHADKAPRFLTADEEQRLRNQLDVREADMRSKRSSGNEWRRARGIPELPEIAPDEFADNIKPLVMLALLTGLRRGDLFDLKWDHVDLERRQIRKVIGKSSHARRKAGLKPKVATLPMPAEAHEILRQCKRQAETQCKRDPEHRANYVFPSPISGTRLNNVKKAFNGVLTDADITRFTFHDLRHTFASRLVQAGVDLNTVRELMTHSDIKMTLIYAHLTDENKSDAVDRAFAKATA